MNQLPEYDVVGDTPGYETPGDIAPVSDTSGSETNTPEGGTPGSQTSTNTKSEKGCLKNKSHSWFICMYILAAIFLFLTLFYSLFFPLVFYFSAEVCYDSITLNKEEQIICPSSSHADNIIGESSGGNISFYRCPTSSLVSNPQTKSVESTVEMNPHQIKYFSYTVTSGSNISVRATSDNNSVEFALIFAFNLEMIMNNKSYRPLRHADGRGFFTYNFKESGEYYVVGIAKDKPDVASFNISMEYQWYTLKEQEIVDSCSERECKFYRMEHYECVVAMNHGYKESNVTLLYRQDVNITLIILAVLFGLVFILLVSLIGYATHNKKKMKKDEKISFETALIDHDVDGNANE